jgi:hypothetical protein
MVNVCADKIEVLSEVGRSVLGKSAQVNVPPGLEGESTSAMPANARMTPPDDPASKATVLPLQPALPHVFPYYYTIPASANHPQALLMQPGDVGGGNGTVVLGGGGLAPNTNNNSYSMDPVAPIMSTGSRPRGVLPAEVRFKSQPAQPIPAHTNMGVMPPSKNLVTFPPAEPKPGSPVVPMPYGLRGSGDVQPAPPPPIVPAVEGGGVGGGGGQPRMPMYHLPYGRGQGVNPAQMAPVHGQTQPGIIPFPLVTRSVQTSTVPGQSPAVMTVSASHPVTTVTPSHTPAVPTNLTRSPTHAASAGSNGGVLQREASMESMTSAMQDVSMRSSPNQVAGPGGPQVSATPSPPACAHTSCQICAQNAQYLHSTSQYGATTVMYPPYSYVLSPGPNGLIPHLPSYYPASQVNSQPGMGQLTNGYGGPDMYSYSPHPAAYPSTLNPSHMYPMMQGSSMYHPSQAPGMAPAGNGGPPVPAQAPAHVQPTGGPLTIKQRNKSCYNCGSRDHRAADCPESSMETMSGKGVYVLDYKPTEESD